MRIVQTITSAAASARRHWRIRAYLVSIEIPRSPMLSWMPFGSFFAS
jgi:hypothetical protein